LSDAKNIFYHVFGSVDRCVGLQLLLMLELTREKWVSRVESLVYGGLYAA